MCIQIPINNYISPDAHTAVYNAACTPCTLFIKFAVRFLFPALPCRFVRNLDHRLATAQADMGETGAALDTVQAGLSRDPSEC